MGKGAWMGHLRRLIRMRYRPYPHHRCLSGRLPTPAYFHSNPVSYLWHAESTKFF